MTRDEINVYIERLNPDDYNFTAILVNNMIGYMDDLEDQITKLKAEKTSTEVFLSNSTFNGYLCDVICWLCKNKHLEDLYEKENK